MKSIISLEMRKNIQDRGLYFWTFVLPIIFTVLFITVLTSGENQEIQKIIIISIVPGYTVMFVFFILITMVSTFIKDRDGGMAARLASTPLSSYDYLIGKWIPYMIIVLIQIAILFIFGKIVYEVPTEQPLLLTMLSFILAFTVTGIGLALALIVKTDNMGIAITQVLALGGALLGGLWMPIDMMPNILKTISKIFPQYWAHQAFQDAMTGTLQTFDFFIACIILLSIGLLGFIIALIRYPYFLRQARN